MKKLKKFLSLISPALILTACGDGGVTISKPAAPIAWVLCLDNTNSVKPENYIMMRDIMIPRLVLSHMKQNDTLNVSECSDQTADKVKMFSAEVAKTQFRQRILDFYQQSISTIAQRKTQATDLLGGISLAARIGKMEALNHTPRRIELFVFTDGLAEGRQSPMSEPLPSDARVYFVGIEPENEAGLKNWIKNTAQLTEDQAQVVRFSEWENFIKPFQEISHRKQNPLLSSLAAK